MTFQELQKKRSAVEDKMDNTLNELKGIVDETARVTEVLANADQILEDLDREFEEKAGLTKTDAAFLFLAIGLQLARQYLVTDFKERKTDKQAATDTPGHREEHSNRKSFNYMPSLQEVISCPVPFDAIYGSKDLRLGLNGKNHRNKTIGHDPILGLIIGTTNIATSTITLTGFDKTYHVKTGKTINGKERDKIVGKASLPEAFRHMANKLFGLEGSLAPHSVYDPISISGPQKGERFAGPAIVAVSLWKEIDHLRSDIGSKKSLPLPFLPSISEDLAFQLASYGLDLANIVTVAKQASYSMLINALIAMIHRMFYSGTTEEESDLFAARTRKILQYSNAVAASSNIAVVALTSKFNKLDLGGIGVAIYRLITDQKFIYTVKREFVFGKFDAMILNEQTE